MISVIISSVDLLLLEKISENIKQTIGVPFEIIAIDGKNNAKGLCHAYNTGAEMSKYEYLCFIHEDVNFITANWGMLLISYFLSDLSVGLVGFAGNICKSKMTSTWPQSYLKGKETRRSNIVQFYKRVEKQSEWNYVNPNNEQISEVVNLDGLFLALKREVWNSNRFDDGLLRGYHGYDLDICLQVGLHNKVIVIYDILVEHYSEGNYDIECMNELYKVHLKWKKELPRIVSGYEWDSQYNYNMSYIKLVQNTKTLIKFRKGYFFVFSRFFGMLSLLDFKKNTVAYFYSIIKEFIKLNIYFLKFQLRKS